MSPRPNRWDGVELGDIDCRDFVELVTDYLEGCLDIATRIRFERHLRDCPGCLTYLDQIRQAQRALGHLAIDTISTNTRTSLLRAFRDWRSACPDESGMA